MLLIMFVGFTNSLIKAQSGYCFGNCHVRLHKQFKDIKINRISFYNLKYRYGWRTTLLIDQRDQGFISGDFAGALNRLLHELRNEGYYTVNINYHAVSNASGIDIEGCRKSITGKGNVQYRRQTTENRNNWSKETFVKKERNQNIQPKKAARDLVELITYYKKSHHNEVYIHNKSSSQVITANVEVNEYRGFEHLQTYYRNFKLNPGEKKLAGHTDNGTIGVTNYSRYTQSIVGAYFSD